ncbi:MAG: hypothetical protein AAFR61_09080 [Bacteroidota bacterium]
MLEVLDLLEEIEALNKMISLHREGGDSLMQAQYRYRKAQILKKLGQLLQAFDIKPEDLAA